MREVHSAAVNSRWSLNRIVIMQRTHERTSVSLCEAENTKIDLYSRDREWAAKMFKLFVEVTPS